MFEENPEDSWGKETLGWWNEYVSSFVLYILISCSLCLCTGRSLDSLVQLLGPKDEQKRTRLVFLAESLT